MSILRSPLTESPLLRNNPILKFPGTGGGWGGAVVYINNTLSPDGIDTLITDTSDTIITNEVA